MAGENSFWSGSSVLRWSCAPVGLLHQHSQSCFLHIKSLAHPRQSDFLVISESVKTTLQATEDQYGLHIKNIASRPDFARALEEIRRHKSRKKGTNIIPWQKHAMENFTPLERWIFCGKAQKLWPYGKHADVDSSLCILYPDLFVDPGREVEDDKNKVAISANESPRWKEVMMSKTLGSVASVLPLAKALGAIVTPHLHSGVTHVLCDLKRHTKLTWKSRGSCDIFTDKKSGLQLHERLVSLEESAVLEGNVDKHVLLVSPDWLEGIWNDV